MLNLPTYINVVFIASVLATLGFVFFAISAAINRKNNIPEVLIPLILVFWMSIVGFCSLLELFPSSGENSLRFSVVIFFPLLIAAGLLVAPTTRTFLKKIPITILTYVHLVRVPVEIVIWWLAALHFLPRVITFEGTNYDILAGISAPFAAIFLVGIKRKRKKLAIAWNIVSLLLLLNAYIQLLLAIPSPIQQIGHFLPNVASFNFPFCWGPAFITPILLLAHVLSLIKLFQKEGELTSSK